MTDKIPSFKDEINNIQVPTDKLDAIISNTVQSSAPKRNGGFRKKVLYSMGAAVVAFGLLVGSATVSPVMATFVSHIPVVGSIFSESGERGLERVSELGLTQVVGESKTVKGNTITIDEVFYDGTRLTVSYSLLSVEPLGEYYLDPAINATINGKNFSFGGNGGQTEITPTYQTGIYNIEPSGIDVPEKFKLGLFFEGEGGERWKFSIPVKTQTGAEFVPVNHTQQVEGIGLSIPNLEISPVGVRLTYNTVSEENGFHFGAFINFRAVDSSGNELVVSSGGGGHVEAVNGKVHTKGNSLFEPIDDNVTELTITPYLDSPSGGGGVEINPNGKETPIDFKPYQGEEIKFDSFTVTLP